ncbi:MAG: hypothetical protein ACOX1E_06865 [Erysipelotrichaceae bacterium]
MVVKTISNGNKIISSKHPDTGIKSGIKSIEDNAYATVTAAIILAKKGVSLSFNAQNKARISVLIFIVSALKFIINCLKDIR